MKQKFFASLDENGIVEDFTSINYSDSLLECSMGPGITNNGPSLGAKYDTNLNAFIPIKPDETYVFNTKTYEWEPNPQLEYNIDDVICRWSPKLQGWIVKENWSDEEHL